jgi:exopolyphosphatase / guanosine-5'-triphosphate,3'-diphosphate pyrophosphatase
MTVVAAVDCGTNSTRLLIVDDDGRTLAREMTITRLGEGVDETRTLSPAALERTYACLSRYGSLMRDLGVDRARLVATSAARDASNGPQFLAEAARITRSEVAILSGDQEAELSYRGATTGLPPTDLPTMIVDIGGGSTELAARIDGSLVSHSMDVGCVRLSERATGPGIVDEDGDQRARVLVRAALATARAEQPDLVSLDGSLRLVGLAGTVSTLAQLDAGRAVYSREATHHRTLSRARVSTWRGTLAAEDPARRLEHPGMVKGREDVLVAGLIILEEVMDLFGANSLLTSENDILDGIVADVLDRPSGA